MTASDSTSPREESARGIASSNEQLHELLEGQVSLIRDLAHGPDRPGERRDLEELEEDLREIADLSALLVAIIECREAE